MCKIPLNALSIKLSDNNDVFASTNNELPKETDTLEINDEMMCNCDCVSSCIDSFDYPLTQSKGFIH